MDGEVFDLERAKEKNDGTEENASVKIAENNGERRRAKQFFFRTKSRRYRQS